MDFNPKCYSQKRIVIFPLLSQQLWNFSPVSTVREFYKTSKVQFCFLLCINTSSWRHFRDVAFNILNSEMWPPKSFFHLHNIRQIFSRPFVMLISHLGQQVLSMQGIYSIAADFTGTKSHTKHSTKHTIICHYNLPNCNYRWYF